MKYLVRLFLAAAIFPYRVAIAQEITYTVSADLNNQMVSIDSILFENLSNNTSLWFKNLPVQEDYIINLTLKKLESTTGVFSNKSEEQYRVLRSYPGFLSIYCSPLSDENVTISVYTLQGQKLYTSETMPVSNGNTVNVNLGDEGVYLVRIISKTGIKTFKAIGSSSGSNINVSVGQTGATEIPEFKKSKMIKGDDFSFNLGDSLRVSVYKNTFYSRPDELLIDVSKPLMFTLKESMVDSYGVSDAFKIISQEMQGSLSFDPISGQIRMPFPDPDLIPLPGEIIAVENDTTGFLRKIVGVTEENGELILESVSAYLNEVFVNMALKLDTRFREPGSPFKKSGSAGEISKALTDERGYIHPVEVLYHRKDGTTSRKSVFSTAKGPESSVQLIDFLHDLSGKNIYGYE